MERYRWTLPDVDHVFLPGHRIMVQIQSSLFPLYDRNPQTYVDNIMYAKPGDYTKATQSVWFGGATRARWCYRLYLSFVVSRRAYVWRGATRSGGAGDVA